jgi:hypothetical protein
VRDGWKKRQQQAQRWLFITMVPFANKYSVWLGENRLAPDLIIIA